MKVADARAIIGNRQLQILAKAGFIETYADENPNYVTATRGQKPMCLWVRIGPVEYVEPRMGGPNKAGEKGITKAIRTLELAGYTVEKRR